MRTRTAFKNNKFYQREIQGFKIKNSNKVKCRGLRPLLELS